MLPDPLLLSHSSQEALFHPRQGYPALLLAPPVPHAHRPWASSADLGPHPFAAALTRGASCQLDRGLRPCPRHSLRPAGRPGPCSQTQTLSGTLHLPTPSGAGLRTAGRRPKTWVPRPRGCRRRGREWTGCSPRSSCPRGATAYTGTGAGPASVAALASPRDPPPLGVRNTTLHRKPSHWMGGLHPPHTCNLWVPRLNLPHWGLTLYPAGWEDHSLSQGIAPRGSAGRRGGARERGRPQLSPALLTKSCYCGPCPRA